MTQEKQLASIQILRAYAAGTVAVGHALLEARTIAQGNGETFDISFLAWGFGVDVFFVISGFIMAYSTVSDFGRQGAPGRFLWRRLIRIVPLYWLLTAALVAIAFVGATSSRPTTWDVVSSFLFIPDEALSGAIVPVLTVGWSLNYEMLFYMVFGAALFAPPRFVLPIVTGVIGLLILAGVVFRPEAAPLQVWTSSLSAEFVYGIWIAVAVMAGVAITGAARIVLTITALALTLVTMFVLLNIPGPRALVYGIPAALLVICALSWNLNGRTWWGLTILGDASYSLYLSHMFAVRLARKLWEAVGFGGANPWLFVVFALILSILAALACYYLIERPITRWLKNKRIPAHPKAG